MNASAKKIQNISFYKFTVVESPHVLCSELHALCKKLRLKGTILVAQEGINGMVSGSHCEILDFKEALTEDLGFNNMLFKSSYSEKLPFKRLLVKVKKEILTLGIESTNPIKKIAPYIQPKELAKELSENKDIVLIDVRNHFEVGYGTFKGALNPETASFSQFPNFVKSKLKAKKNQKIVTFCTGGIRCEKGCAILLNEGFENVYQLEGGILEYFAQTGGAHFEGICFVFDERVALDKNLNPVKD